MRTKLAAAALLLGAGTLAFPAISYGAEQLLDGDSVHHSTDVNDHDPAHHQPYVYYSASTGTARSVPVAGFDASGHVIGTAPASDNVPAHHSTDMNDKDPVHHQPNVVNGVIVPLPGFDASGYPLAKFS